MAKADTLSAILRQTLAALAATAGQAQERRNEGVSQ